MIGKELPWLKSGLRNYCDQLIDADRLSDMDSYLLNYVQALLDFMSSEPSSWGRSNSVKGETLTVLHVQSFIEKSGRKAITVSIVSGSLFPCLILNF